MDVTARPAVGAVWTALTPDVGVPSPVLVTGSHGDYDIEMTLTVQPSSDGLTGQLVCSSLTTRQRDGGPPVTSVGLRALAVAQLVRQAAGQVVGPRRPAGVAAGSWSFAGGASGASRGGPDTLTATANDGAGVTDSAHAALTRGGDPDQVRREGPTDSNLQWVASVYRSALARGDRPTVAVQTALGLPRSTAGDWLRAARDRGYLPPSSGRGKATG